MSEMAQCTLVKIVFEAGGCERGGEDDLEESGLKTRRNQPKKEK